MTILQFPKRSESTELYEHYRQDIKLLVNCLEKFIADEGDSVPFSLVPKRMVENHMSLLTMRPNDVTIIRPYKRRPSAMSKPKANLYEGACGTVQDIFTILEEDNLEDWFDDVPLFYKSARDLYQLVIEAKERKDDDANEDDEDNDDEAG